jgi:hypothetical protein
MMGTAPVNPDIVICEKESLAHRATLVCSVTDMVFSPQGLALSWLISLTVSMGLYRNSTEPSRGSLLLHRLRDRPGLGTAGVIIALMPQSDW